MFQGRDRLHIVPDYLLGDQSRHFQNNQEVAQGGYLNLTTVIKVLDGVSLRKGIRYISSSRQSPFDMAGEVT